MNLNDAIRNRRSVRKYKAGNTMPEEHLKMILEAAMMAPSACNTRPWEFVVLKSEEAKLKAKKLHPYVREIENTCVAILVCARPEIQQGVAEGYFPQDCGAAIENILLQSLELGYGTCWCGVYPKTERVEMFKKEFNLTSTPMAVVNIGVADEEPVQRGFYEPEKVTVL